MKRQSSVAIQINLGNNLGNSSEGVNAISTSPSGGAAGGSHDSSPQIPLKAVSSDFNETDLFYPETYDVTKEKNYSINSDEPIVSSKTPTASESNLESELESGENSENKYLLPKNEKKSSIIPLNFSRSSFINFLKVLNILYAVWVSSVFGLMSFFRASGHDDFDDVPLKQALIGAFYMFCSFAINIPMAYLFSDKVIKLSKELKKPNAILKTATALGLILGASTTAAGIAVSNESTAWMDGKLGPMSQTMRMATTAMFGWNTFSTRMLPLAYTINSLLTESVEQFRKRIRFRNDTDAQQFLQLIDDLKRSSLTLGHEVLPAAANDGALIQEFYDLLKDRNFSPEIAAKERLKEAFFLIAQLSLSLTAFLSFAMWLTLTERGLNTVKPGWGEIAPLTVFCSLSHLALYCRTAFFVPPTLRGINNRPSFLMVSTGKKLLALTLLFAPIAVMAWFSGAGYSQVAKGMEEKGYGNVANQLLLESDHWFAKMYQAGFDAVEPIFVSLYYFLMSGLVVNGSSALTGFFDYAPQWLREKLPVFFGSARKKSDFKDDSEKQPMIEKSGQTVNSFKANMERTLWFGAKEEVERLGISAGAARKVWASSKTEEEEPALKSSCCLI